jgi:hypothetical protein
LLTQRNWTIGVVEITLGVTKFMSVASHLLAAIAPLAVWIGFTYGVERLFDGKVAQTTQLDIRLPKQFVRTCGVEKLRASKHVAQVKDLLNVGLTVDLQSEPATSVTVLPVTEDRVRIQGAWLLKNHSHELELLYKSQIDQIAGVLLECNTSGAPAK